MDIDQLPLIASRALLGGEVVSVEVQDATAVLRYLPPPEMANPLGSVQGGFVWAMLDDAASLLVAMVTHQAAATIQVSVNYLRRVPVEEWLQAQARLIHRGRNQIVCGAELYRESNGKLLATATATCMLLTAAL